MARPAGSVLGNISVRAKLAFGFGLVLLLTLMISLTGWSSLSSLTNRSDKLITIAKMAEMFRDLRVARLSYSLNYDAEHATAVVKVMDNLDPHIRKLQGQLVQPEDIKLLGDTQKLLNEYRSLFGQYRQAIENREATRDIFGKYADAGAAELEQLNSALAKLQVEPDAQLQRETQDKAVVAEERLFQGARFALRGFTYSGKASMYPGALAAIDAARANIKALSDTLPPSLVEGAARLDKALVGYRATTDQFRTAQIASEDAAKAIGDHMTTMLLLSDQMTQNQIQWREADTQQARIILIGAAIGALLLGFIAAMLITGQIVKPLNETLLVVERVAAGDLSEQPRTERGDELGKLQAAIHGMTGSLRTLISGIRDGVTHISSAAEQLSAVTEQTSIGVNTQKSETDQLATAMNEMTATVQEVARNAEQASTAAAGADREARAGDEVVNKAIAQIDRLATEVGHSTVAMSELKRETDKIGSMLDVIKSVAEQTNLLALNAAIEAARAGEAGRGFAVVADEVRSLAQRTQKSTEEIEGLITGLQSGTQQVSTTLENSRALSDSSVDLARQAGQSLESITRSVAAIQSMNQQIATAAEEQTAVADDINRSVISVRDVSEQTATASDKTAASSVELARLGNQLQTLVSRFRV